MMSQLPKWFLDFVAAAPRVPESVLLLQELVLVI